MAVSAPEDDDKIIPLGDGYGSDPYNEDAVMAAIATIREACSSKGHRCLIIVDPDDGAFFAGYSGSLEWMHFMAGRIMRMAMDEKAGSAIEMMDLEFEVGDE